MLKIYTDGGFSIPYNKGGYGVIAVKDGTKEVFSQSELVTDSTNNKMELTAFIKALEYLKTLGEVDCTILTDSNYVLQGFKTWMYGWKAKNWVKADGKAVKNQELWENLYSLRDIKVKVEKVKAHQKKPELYSDGYWNNKVDELTRESN